MPARAIGLLWRVLLGWMLAAPALSAAPAQALRLIDRSDLAGPALRLGEESRDWLANRSQLTLGTSAPDYPPFDLSNDGVTYEGLTADYAVLIGKALGLPVRVLRYSSRTAAAQALQAGEIDLLGSANSFEAALPAVVVSTAYAEDRPALVTRFEPGVDLPDDLAGQRLAVLDHYLPASLLRTRYPKALLQFYPSYPEALGTVAFGQADVFLGDTLATYQQIEKGHLQNIQIQRLEAHERLGFGFAVRADNQRLLKLLNLSLAVIPAATRKSIQRRWSAGSDALLDRAGLALTPEERRWISDHPVVRVAVNEGFAPLTFFDQQGQLRGISADLLELIRLQTGLRFETQRSPNVEALIRRVESDEADVVAALIPSDARRRRLRFSTPYLFTPYALLSANRPDSPASLEQLKYKRLAINRGSPLLNYLHAGYPDIQLIEADDSFATLDLVAQDKADAAISPLLTATYFVSSTLFEHRLRIRSTLGVDAGGFAFATQRGAAELRGILDKALASIAPEQLAVITSRWRGYHPPPGTYWRNYHRLILQIAAVAALLVVIAAGWALLTRRALRRREQAQRALNDQLELMRALVEGTPHPVYIRDRAGLLQSCNDSYLAALQVERHNVLGKRLIDSDIGSGPEAALFEKDYEQVMREASPLIVDRTLVLGGRRQTIYHWVLPYRDSTANVCGLVGGWIDISERRQLFDDLRTAKDQADAANRAKSTFLATMSHEIRTPMNAVIGLLELALERADRGQLDRNGLQVAHGCARGLLELIGDILDIARIESGHLCITLQRVAVHDLVESVVQAFEGVARQKRLHLSLDAERDIRRQEVLLDPLRLKQVLSNLVSNAIKFTERGEITVRLDLHPRAGSEQLELTIGVHDTGIGISQQDQQRLFQPFAQVSAAADGQADGAGLGLLISRGLCHAMGAELTLHSHPGRGTLAEVKLLATPLGEAPAKRLAAPPERNVDPGLRVLVVDDNAANRLLTAQQLEHLGVQATVTTTAERALEEWRTQSFDVLIIDCSMPGMNGYQLTRQLRLEEGNLQRPRCTVLGYTANAQPEAHQRCLDAGMDDCLFKPLDLEGLNRYLSRVMPLPSRAPTGLFRLQALNAMTGDDPRQIRRLLEQVLIGCRTDLAILRDPNLDTAPVAMATLAHKILGAARIIDARPLRTVCERIIQAAEEPPAPCDAHQALEHALGDLALAIEHSLERLPGPVKG